MFTHMCIPMIYSFRNNKRVLYYKICALATVTTLTLMYTYREDGPRLLMNKKRVVEVVSCHYLTEKGAADALPAVESMSPRPDSIFFLETSCTGGLSFRQACAVESAARLHPTRDVYIFFNSPVSDSTLKSSSLSVLTQKYKNIKLARLHSVEYGKGTVMQAMLAGKINTLSSWPVEHTADVLRFITMYKYGGIYLDTDVILIKPLEGLGKNWVARQDNVAVNIAAMAFDLDYVGRTLTALILNEMKNFQPDIWDYNGAGSLQRALNKFCNTSAIRDMTATMCHGFRVLDPWSFYAVPWEASKILFEKGVLPLNITRNKYRVYGHHLWNNLSREMRVEMRSPFETLARKSCPSIRWAYGTNFGA